MLDDSGAGAGRDLGAPLFTAAHCSKEFSASLTQSYTELKESHLWPPSMHYTLYSQLLLAHVSERTRQN